MGDTAKQVIDAGKASVAELQAARPELVILDKRPNAEVQEAFSERVGKIDVAEETRTALRGLMGASEDTINDQLELAAYRLHNLEMSDEAREATAGILSATAKQFGAELPTIKAAEASSPEGAKPEGAKPEDAKPDATVTPIDEARDKRLNLLEGKDAAAEAIAALSDVSPEYTAQIKSEVMAMLEAGTLQGREAVAEHITSQVKRDKVAKEALDASGTAAPTGLTPTTQGNEAPAQHAAAGQFFPGPKPTEGGS